MITINEGFESIMRLTNTSVSKLASSTGLSEAFLNSLKNNARRMSLDSFEKITEFLNLHGSFFMFYVEKAEKDDLSREEFKEIEEKYKKRYDKHPWLDENINIDSFTTSSKDDSKSKKEAQLLANDITNAQNLTEREKRVLNLRLGLFDGKKYTLAEVGKELNGLTRERVRQIESKALGKIKRKDSFK